MIRTLFSILRSPLLVGSVASVAFYAPFHLGWVHSKFIDDYFAGHPIEYATTVLFFVGLAALLNKAVDVARASSFLCRRPSILDRLLSEEELDALNASGVSASEYRGRSRDRGLLELQTCEPLVKKLEQKVNASPSDKVLRRIYNVLDRMVRSGTVEHLDDELHYASETESDRIYSDYALFRVVVWAVPILGFLGTVVGITMAIAELSPDEMVNSIPLVTASLSIAFATTVQALLLVIILMFCKYLVSQAEDRQALRIDREVERELLGRFQSTSDSPDGQVLMIRRMAETMVQVSERLVRQQVELWRESIEASEQRWAQVTATAGKQLETALVNAMSKSLKVHAEELTKSEMLLAAKNHELWSHVNGSLQETIRSTSALEESVERQVLVLHKTVEATGQVARLEEALNRNLASLGRANQLEQISTSLSAAIHLLSGQLMESPVGSVRLEQESSAA